MPGPETPILILTGPPGVGKTTIAELVAARRPRAVHLESDAFFHFIRSGYVEPWRPASHAQNRIVMRIVAQAAAGYAAAGYFTIVDGIVIPGVFLAPLRDALRDAGHSVAYAVLRAPLPTCVSRAGARERRPLEKSEVVEQLWRSFHDLGDLEGHAIDVDDEPPATVAATVAARASDGSLLV